MEEWREKVREVKGVERERMTTMRAMVKEKERERDSNSWTIRDRSRHLSKAVGIIAVMTLNSAPSFLWRENPTQSPARERVGGGERASGRERERETGIEGDTERERERERDRGRGRQG